MSDQYQVRGDVNASPNALPSGVSDGPQVHRYEVRPASSRPAQDDTPKPAVRVSDADESSVRITIGRNGEMITDTGRVQRTTGSPDVAPGDFLGTARDAIGTPVSRDKIGPKTVIKIGDTWDTVAAWQSAGVIGPDLKMVEQKTEEAPAPAKLDFEMSSEGENVLRASFEKLGQPFMYSVYDNVIEKGTLTEARVSEIASRMGIEPAQANEMITTRVNEYVGHAMKLTGLEGHDFWSASDHLWSTRTDEMREAVNAFALEHRAGPLKKLFDGYKASAAAYNEDALENATFGDGVDVYRDSSTRKLMVNARGDVLPLADAIKHGIVAVSRKK